MAGGIREHGVRQPAAAEREHLWRRGRHVIDHDIEMHLLWHAGTGPRRCLVVRRELEGEPGGLLVVGHHDPVRAVVGDRLTEQCRVEVGQVARVGAVDDGVVPASDHALDLAPVSCGARDDPT